MFWDLEDMIERAEYFIWWTPNQFCIRNLIQFQEECEEFQDELSNIGGPELSKLE